MKRYFSTLFLILLSSLFTITCALADDLDDDRPRNTEPQIFHVGDGLDIISRLKLQYGKSRIIVRSIFPQLETDNELTEGIDNFNENVKELVQQQVEQFKVIVAANQAAQQNLDKESIRNDLYIDYNTSAIKSGKDRILSIRFSMKGNISGLKHSYHYHRVLNYDLDNDEPIELEDLFKPDANYLEVLSQYAREDLSKRFTNKSLIDEGTAPEEENYQNWNIKPQGLLITFENYQVAPSIYGSQTVLVPYSFLKDILASDSPIADCIKHRKRCAQNNLLTGGFMETAVNTRHRGLNPILRKS